MAVNTADVTWTRAEGEDFRAGRYSRGYTVRFDGGTAVPGSASPLTAIMPQGRWTPSRRGGRR